MSERVLSVEDLSVVLHRDGRPGVALDKVGFTLFAGEILAVVGESGSGKSTIGLAVQGLLPREHQPRVSGSIRLADIELVAAPESTLRAARRSLVRVIPQDPMGALNPTMTIRDQLRESVSVSDQEMLGWLRRTGLADAERVASTFPHRLSGGQRQRVLIAMAMMARPRLIIADEPTTALDAEIQGQILAMLAELAREQGTAILFITHDLGIAATFADRLAVLHAGRLVEIGATADVIGKPHHPYTAALLKARFDLATDRSRPLPTLGGRQPSIDAPWPAREIDRSDVVLELSGISKSYVVGSLPFWRARAPRPVLASIDLSIARGECVALLGESGAGKSTLLRIAGGLLAPDGGSLFRADEQPQVVFQDAVASLTPWLTIGEQIGERLRAQRVDVRERQRRVEEALALVGLDVALQKALPSELSVGQCQRAVVARAIVVPPELLLCDEPVSAMDVSLAAATLNLLNDLRRRLGMAMLFVTHDLAAARIIADRIVVLRDGLIASELDPEAVLMPAGAVPALAAIRPSRLHAAGLGP